jgi:quercetin dioxygenase-like cupin family protein
MTATMTTGKCVGLERDGGFEAERAPSRRRLALAAVVGGLALVATSAALALVAQPASTTHPARPARSVVTASAAALPNVGTASETYEPGHTSGWHVHPGVHSVVVLSGTLTIYDEHCARTDYGPGETYLGGNRPHLARNEGTDDLNVAITYVYSSTSQTPGSPVAGPAGCGVR